MRPAEFHAAVLSNEGFAIERLTGPENCCPLPQVPKVERVATAITLKFIIAMKCEDRIMSRADYHCNLSIVALLQVLENKSSSTLLSPCVKQWAGARADDPDRHQAGGGPSDPVRR